MQERIKKDPAVVAILVKALLVAYALTGVLLLVLAFLVFKMNLKQEVVELAILFIYIATAFVGGFLAGKMGKVKKFIWGVGTGTGYVLILLAVSLAINGGLSGEAGSCLTTLVMCAGAGMLGGMFS